MDTALFVTSAGETKEDSTLVCFTETKEKEVCLCVCTWTKHLLIFIMTLHSEFVC